MGGFRGKVGNIVGCKYKNGFYIRQLPAKSTTPPTEKQLANRERFKLAQFFIAGLRQLNKSLPEERRKEIQCSPRQVMQQSINGDYPGQSLNYSKIKLTKGYSINGSNHAATYDQSGIIFSWTKTMPDYYFSIAVLLAYNPAENCWMYSLVKPGGAFNAAINIPADFPAGQLETWIFFMSHDFRQVSASVHSGSVMLPEPEPALLTTKY